MLGSRLPIALALLVVLALAIGLVSGEVVPALMVLIGGGALIWWLIGAQAAPSISAPQPLPPTPTNFTALLIAALSDPVLIISNAKVTRANQAAQSLLGAHIVNQNVRVALRHPDIAPLFAKDAADGIIEVAGLGGREMHWEIRLSTISPDTRLVQMVDRTARYAAERARTDFVANASHELRTPLAAVLGFIETLSDDAAGADPKTRARFLKVMESEAQRMQRLIDDLISLSRIEAERYQPPQTPIDLASLITQSARELRTPRGDVVNVVLDFDDDLPDMSGDRTQLQQLIHNLLSNALKYGRADVPVRVTLAREGDKALKMQVIDQGEGITPEHLPRLTERFYRIDSARSRAGGGTGLGLAIVKHIVERHRGKLDISSTIGVGTTVSVIFLL